MFLTVVNVSLFTFSVVSILCWCCFVPRVHPSHFVSFILARQPSVGHGFLIHEVPRSHTHTHNDAPQSVGLLWTSDQLVAKNSTWQNTTLTTHKYPSPAAGFEPTISEGKRPQTYSLDHVANGTSHPSAPYVNFISVKTYDTNI